MNILIVSAHPDDEILGVGGTIGRHIESGDKVIVCMVTKAHTPEWSEEYIQNKISEQNKVDKFLGISKRYMLGLPTVKLNTLSHGTLNKKIMDVVEQANPDIIYTHFENDMNYDHTLIFRSVMVATRPPNQIEVRCFETLSETEWNNKTFVPNMWIEISPHIETKIKAFNIYKSEVKQYPHPRSSEGIKVLAQKRGMDICVPFAEAFQVVRRYWVCE